MPHILTKTVYYFDELSDAAKDKARDWFRTDYPSHGWWEPVYDDATQCAAILGIEIAPRNQRCIGGYTAGKWDANKVTIDSSPAIFFSGFSSQGDGACFEGSYRYAKGAHKAIRKHAPQDTELHRIADELLALQRANGYRLTAAMKQSGHYSHSGCMTVTVDDNETVIDGWLDIESKVMRLMRDFADWVYKQLNNEYDYQTADAQVDESIRANEYEFTDTGRRTC